MSNEDAKCVECGFVLPDHKPNCGIATVERYCCYMRCEKGVAEFEITWGNGPDDFTDACEDHVGALIGHHLDQRPPDHYVVRPIASND